MAQGHKVSQRRNYGAKLKLYSPTPVPCYCTTPYHANHYGNDNEEIRSPVDLPNITLPLVAFYRPLPTYLLLLDNSATWQGLQGLPRASQPAPSPGQTAVLWHPDSCSLREDNQATAPGGTAPQEEAWGRISWETEVLSRTESALLLPREDPRMDITKHYVSTQRK